VDKRAKVDKLLNYHEISGFQIQNLCKYTLEVSGNDKRVALAYFIAGNVIFDKKLVGLVGWCQTMCFLSASLYVSKRGAY